MDPISKSQATPANRRLLKGGHDPRMGKANQFTPGKSGNPSGRPKNSISGVYRKWLKKPKNRAKIENFIDETIEKRGMAGVLLIREMTERDEGKVADIVDMSVTGSISLEQVLEARKKAGK